MKFKKGENEKNNYRPVRHHTMGGGMNLDATLFTVTELNDFAVLAERSSVVIRVKNTENLTINNLKEIAKLGRGKVIFEFKKM